MGPERAQVVAVLAEGVLARRALRFALGGALVFAAPDLEALPDFDEGQALLGVPRLVRVDAVLLHGVVGGRLVVAVALLLLLIVARRVVAVLEPRPEDAPVFRRVLGLPGVLHGSVDGRSGYHPTTTTTTRPAHRLGLPRSA